MMLQFAFGLVVGEAVHDDAIPRAVARRKHGETMDEILRLQLADGD